MCTTTHPCGNATTPVYQATWLGTAATHIATTHANSPLPLLVQAVLNELTSAGRSFTAYDVTLIARALSPQRYLPHYDQHGAPGIQPEVHRQMAGYLASGCYTMRDIFPAGKDAVTLYTSAARLGRARSLLNLWRACRSGSGNAHLPHGAWVVKG